MRAQIHAVVIGLLAGRPDADMALRRGKILIAGFEYMHSMRAHFGAFTA